METRWLTRPPFQHTILHSNQEETETALETGQTHTLLSRVLCSSLHAIRCIRSMERAQLPQFSNAARALVVLIRALCAHVIRLTPACGEFGSLNGGGPSQYTRSLSAAPPDPSRSRRQYGALRPPAQAHATREVLFLLPSSSFSFIRIPPSSAATNRRISAATPARRSTGLCACLRPRPRPPTAHCSEAMQSSSGSSSDQSASILSSVHPLSTTLTFPRRA